jgi:hypothetical protein
MEAITDQTEDIDFFFCSAYFSNRIRIELQGPVPKEGKLPYIDEIAWELHVLMHTHH